MGEVGQKLPDKLYFRIGEVSDIVGVKPYVLRYWETEFGDIKPSKSKSGQRLYKKRDVELLLKIRELLYAERFTISGAKQRLKELGREERSEAENLHETRETEHPEDKEETGAVQQSMFDDVEKTGTKGKPGKTVSTGVDGKFLQKIKTDLEWCLKELRTES